MRLINSKEQLLKNLETLEGYLKSGNEKLVKEAKKLIKRGTCFVAYKKGKQLHFAPSRFVGYISNNLNKHLASTDKHGGYTNIAISHILGERQIPNQKLNSEYLRYCRALEIEPGESGAFGARRKFWQLDIEKSRIDNLKRPGTFPEGKVVERLHKARERNGNVVRLAKAKFKEKYKRLFCQACGFDFGKVYGSIGQDYIEGHHTVPVSQMKANHTTKVQDIAMLCSNCHRMIHIKRPWLSMKDLSKLISRRGDK